MDLVVQWLRVHLPMQGVQVQSLLGELKLKNQKPKHKKKAMW